MLKKVRYYEFHKTKSNLSLLANLFTAGLKTVADLNKVQKRNVKIRHQKYSCRDREFRKRSVVGQ